jgi:hypothetical protein
VRWWLLTFVLLTGSAFAQLTTAVTAQVADVNGSPYVNCQWSVTFVGQSTAPGVGPYAPAALLNGQQGKCDSTGLLTLSLADNVNTVTPTPSQWQFNICSASGYPAGPYCFQKLLTITGTSQNISAALTAVAPVLPAFNGTNLLPGTPTGSIQVATGSSVFAGAPSPIYASQRPGADCGAKINSADAALGSNAGEIWLDKNCGSTLTTPVTLSANHHLKVVQGGLYTYCGEWKLNTSSSLEGTISGFVENISVQPLPPVLFQQAPGCNLAVNFDIVGANVAISNIGLSFNNSSNAAGVGIQTDTTTCSTNGCLGHLLLDGVTIAQGYSNNIVIQSTGTIDQAVGAQIWRTVSENSLNGDGLTVLKTTDVKLHNYFGETNGNCGITITGSTVWTDTSPDISTNNNCGVYISGTPSNPAGLVIEIPSITSPSLTSGVNASLDGGIVVQGWDSTSSTCNNASLIIIGGAFSVTGGTQTNAWDMIHIENTGGDRIAFSNFLGPASGSVARYGYYHGNTHACTLQPDVIIGNEFVGTFGTGSSSLFSYLSGDVLLANNESGNAGSSLAEFTNHYLPNTYPLYAANAAGAPQKALFTDASNNLWITGDPTAGVIAFQPHGTGATIASLTNSGMQLGALAVTNSEVTHNILTGSGTLTYTAISTQTCQEQAITVTGASATAGAATASPNATLGSTNLSWSAWVSATNTVSVRVCNVATTSTITPSAVTWTAFVMQ